MKLSHSQEIQHIPKALTQFLQRENLVGAKGEWRAEPLTGGVSSDIWKIITTDRVFCIKSALAKLRTKQDWYAPVSRNGTEVDWFLTVAEIVPQAVPDILAYDKKAGIFAMDFLAPEQYPIWKAELASGQIDVNFARHVGELLSSIHAQTFDQDDIAQRFDTQKQFSDLRLSPYLWQLASVYPALQSPIEDIVTMLAGNNKAMIHGDISPKNILSGPDGPIFLDAETACYGDPAFDLGFCLNHLLLKMVWVPQDRTALLDSFYALKNSYLDGVSWENSKQLDQRTARLLPALLLARIDGKSPVEYITDTGEKNKIRQLTRPLLEAGENIYLDDIARLWAEVF